MGSDYAWMSEQLSRDLGIRTRQLLPIDARELPTAEEYVKRLKAALHAEKVVPVLLAACKAAESVLDNLDRGKDIGGDPDVLATLRAAIAAAEGNKAA